MVVDINANSFIDAISSCIVSARYISDRLNNIKEQSNNNIFLLITS